MAIRRMPLLATAMAVMSLSLPAVVLANSVDAVTGCSWVSGRVGQDNTQNGKILYYASDPWNPKVGYYTTVWERTPFNQPVVTAGDAPGGTWYSGTDPNFGHAAWRQDGTFTVWGDATKTLTTKATALSARTTVLIGTTTGAGHTYDDYARCASSSGWVTITT
jgi:hypothetical protein